MTRSDRGKARLGSPGFRSAVLAGAVALGALVLGALTSLPARAQQIAITFDDLPAHSALPPGVTRQEVAARIIAALKAADVPPVYGFVNGVREVEEPASKGVLEAWRAAGFPLGNHTWSHMNLNSRSLAEWTDDLIRNEPVIAARMDGADWRWLRYPFLAEGDTPQKRADARAVLAARNYRIAGVTMGFADYAFNEPYARCQAKGDKAAVERLEQAYLQGAAVEFDRSRAMSKALYGRDIPYVLLMHLGAFDARMLPALLDLYRQRGASFVGLEQAERDPFYRVDLDPASAAGPDTLEGAMWARGLTPPRSPDLAWLAGLCR